MQIGDKVRILPHQTMSGNLSEFSGETGTIVDMEYTGESLWVSVETEWTRKHGREGYPVQEEFVTIVPEEG